MKLKVFSPFVVPAFVFLFFTGSIHAQNNSGFESGLEGWQGSGMISLDGNAQSFKGNRCLRMEGSSAMILQSAFVKPLSIVQLSAFVKTSPGEVLGYSFLRFYDSRDSLILEFKSTPFSSVNYLETGCYTLAPARSTYLKYGVIKMPGNGILFADEIELKINPGEKNALNPPSVNIDQYLIPFWESDTVFNETVLLLSEDNSKPSGKLLFNPSRIISIRSYNLKTTYSEGADYSLKGNIITKTDGSSIPSAADTSFSKKDLTWYDLQSEWIVVTYVHKDKWKGSIPGYLGSEMPVTINKLLSASSLRIVACGMSITRGMDVSGYHNLPPYMPPYVDLLVRKLKKKYNYNDITLYNAGLPGAKADWAAQYADEYINSFDPDLVIIDFGMNDFWSYSPAQFKNYIETIIQKCRVHNRNVEFLLISNMKFDPDYISPANNYKTFYESNLIGYNTALQSLCSTGIINLDMTTLSDEIYKMKKAKDCLANPLHPNDYMARWYAQCMAELFIKH
jgi:lysophospholipase L1-like esterase